ncbi:MAG: aldehyde ferredoxin oxidoreductase family protein [Desulfobacteraceae bacterium]|uniref:Aldehyde ferredoxin oxidoreductase family protein n=1 Tax=Candidatus Desulfacyla euxinica TaxID=2841693 RepID=A0A8J6MZZ4_9DELT|nr:aldehyde ferredoxin oxidoreductase family protein [Candidatus Desulfacyla euxinica]MBL6978798.1 aldehyde ferredoxin oxidoreductase family protein [Desulfobacteraceae bacterium]
MKTIVGKTAIIDLSARTVAVEDTPIQLVYHLLGGRGVNMAYLYRMLPLKTDALGPENVLIFGTGLLTGYPVPNSGRMNISAKSPESGILGDSNMGGFFPAAMKKSGFDRLVITGRANWPVYVLLSNGSVEIRDADPYWGLIVPDTQTALEQDLGKGVRSAVIGPAGENLVRFATVMNARKNAAGRCGMGAVMGSKNLKAVVAAGDAPLKIADPPGLRALRKELTKYLQASKIIQIYGKVGTALLYEPANKLGAMRTKNGQMNQWSSNLNASEIDPHIDRMTACSDCTVHCRHVNKYGGEGPDFVATALLGANTGIDDFTEVIKLNNLCNDLGIDTASAGTLIPWAMELYQRGIIDDKQTGGPLLWGDVERVRGLLVDISERRGFGDVLADSSQSIPLGKMPPEAADYLIAVKNLPQSDGHDPRYIKSFALGVAVASRGADHLRNRPTMDILRLPDDLRERVYGAPTEGDPTVYETKERVVDFSDKIFAVCDALGICRFVCQGWNSPKLLGYRHFSRMIKEAVGLEVDPGDLDEIGRRVIDLERLINQREGLTRADDTLPRRYFEDPMPSGHTKGHKIDRKQFENLIDCYYELKGWDLEGNLTPERTAEIQEITKIARMSPD